MCFKFMSIIIVFHTLLLYLHPNFLSSAGKPQLTTELVQLFLHENRFGIRIVPDPFQPCDDDVANTPSSAVGKGLVHQTTYPPLDLII